MLLAQVTVDLGYAVSLLKFLLATCLLGVALYTFVLPLLRLPSGPTPPPVISSKPKPKRRDVDRSSDTPPPVGFAEHLKIIEVAAPNANPGVWWEYAKAEMTEAEVALAEAKLARQPDPNA
jgi:hypothetical protein